ncbi:MAG: hypothetical protein CR986_07860 [Ignavibacteriae bacterium]|nr:MAG: hypothetical protein CR986_07860 [Ignavibacteriota bacterium]
MFKNEKNIVKSILFILFLLLTTGCGKKENDNSQNYIVDDLYNKISLENVPKRIVTLAPNLTELVYAVGEGDKIVGNTTYCNFPETTKDKEKIGDLLTINFEKILSLKPDIIFMTKEGNSKSNYTKLKELGLNVFVSAPNNYRGIKKTLSDIGKIFHKTEIIDSITKSWDTRIDSVKKTHEKLLFNSALFLVSAKPIFSIGKNSFINELLNFAGLKNLSANTEISYPMLNREEVLVKNPDVLILYRTNKNDISEILEIYPEWNTLSAIVNNRVIFVNPDLYSRPGPRFVDAVVELNKRIKEM